MIDVFAVGDIIRFRCLVQATFSDTVGTEMDWMSMSGLGDQRRGGGGGGGGCCWRVWWKC